MPVDSRERNLLINLAQSEGFDLLLRIFECEYAELCVKAIEDAASNLFIEPENIEATGVFKEAAKVKVVIDKLEQVANMSRDGEFFTAKHIEINERTE